MDTEEGEWETMHAGHAMARMWKRGRASGKIKMQPVGNLVRWTGLVTATVFKLPTNADPFAPLPPFPLRSPRHWPLLPPLLLLLPLVAIFGLLPG